MSKSVCRIALVMFVIACVLLSVNPELAMLGYHVTVISHVIHSSMPVIVMDHSTAHMTSEVISAWQHHYIHIQHLAHLAHVRHERG